MDIASIVERVEQVEKRRRGKVEQFLELLRDPDLAQYVALLRNGHQPEAAQAVVPKASHVRTVSTRLMHSAKSKAPTGIKDAVRALQLPTPFTSGDVLTQLTTNAFHFGHREPKRAVLDVLYAMSHGQNPELRIVQQGGGGKRSIYTRVK